MQNHVPSERLASLIQRFNDKCEISSKHVSTTYAEKLKRLRQNYDVSARPGYLNDPITLTKQKYDSSNFLSISDDCTNSNILPVFDTQGMNKDPLNETQEYIVSILLPIQVRPVSFNNITLRLIKLIHADQWFEVHSKKSKTASLLFRTLEKGGNKFFSIIL